MIKNTLRKKGQSTPLTMVFWAIIFFLVLAGGLAYMINDMISVSMYLGNLTGIEAFFYTNFLFFIIISFILAIIYWGSQ